MKGGWTYRRVGNVSKWVLGNSWVTRHSDSSICYWGVMGRPRGSIYGSPKEIRKLVEKELQP